MTEGNSPERFRPWVKIYNMGTEDPADALASGLCMAGADFLPEKNIKLAVGRGIGRGCIKHQTDL